MQSMSERPHLAQSEDRGSSMAHQQGSTSFDPSYLIDKRGNWVHNPIHFSVEKGPCAVSPMPSEPPGYPQGAPRVPSGYLASHLQGSDSVQNFVDLPHGHLGGRQLGTATSQGALGDVHNNLEGHLRHAVMSQGPPGPSAFHQNFVRGPQNPPAGHVRESDPSPITSDGHGMAYSAALLNKPRGDSIWVCPKPSKQRVVPVSPQS